LIDDGSEVNFCKKNQTLQAEVDDFIFLEKNIGRAAIRNRFLDIAKHPYLLFLDCDSTIIRPDFLEKYITYLIDNQTFVLCGGNDYPTPSPAKTYQLRWYYSHTKESRSARATQGNLAFMTNNFLIKKEILARIKFDESLTQYGHEDTLLGYELKKNNIAIVHLDNPVMNDVLDSNEIFIEKTEKSLENLAKIAQKLHFETDFIEEVKILKFYFLVKKLKLTPLLSISYFFFGKILRHLFSKGNIKNLKLYDAYKLMYLSEKFTYPSR
jgi:cellulose synthase/poly-beta-1,6-N-acetylglucosamine synthase-like glycosyltransferase